MTHDADKDVCVAALGVLNSAMLSAQVRFFINGGEGASGRPPVSARLPARLQLTADEITIILRALVDDHAEVRSAAASIVVQQVGNELMARRLQLPSLYPVLPRSPQLPAFEGGDDAPAAGDGDDAGDADGAPSAAAGGSKAAKSGKAKAKRAATAAVAIASRSRARLLSIVAMMQDLVSTAASSAADGAEPAIVARVLERIVSALWGLPVLTDWAAYAHLLVVGDDTIPVASGTELALVRLLATVALRAASGVDLTAPADEKSAAAAAAATAAATAAMVGPVPPGAGSPNLKAPSSSAGAVSDAHRAARDELTSALALSLPDIFAKVGGGRGGAAGWLAS